MAKLAKRIFPEKFLMELDRRLASTKIALAAEEYIGLSLLVTVILGIVVGVLGAILTLPLPSFLLVPLVVIVTFPTLVLYLPRFLAQRRADELERVLPDALRQMSSTLRAGVSIDAALEDISKSRYGELSKEFERVVSEVKRGRTLESALLAMARRSHSALYDRAFKLIVEGIERGAALANVLEAVAGDAKEVHAIQRERRTMTTQQVMFLFAVALFAAPFIIGLTVGVGGIKAGSGAASSGGLPPEMNTIAMIYVIIQAFVCGLAVGIIKFGRMSKGFGYSLAFVIASYIVFSFAQTIVGSMAPAGA
ncbi:MAG: type II secretion system F family protein [Candidatus Hadarchaeota archaeon]